MVNAPTNSEMNAKTSSAVEKKDSAWLTELVLSLTTVCPVTTSTPGGRARALDRGLVGARDGHHVDGTEPARLQGQGLGGRQRERSQRGSGQVVRRAELG